MYTFTNTGLMEEVIRCRNREYPYFWYMEVMREAEKRGFLRITGHSDEKPFWWRQFDESIEILNDQLREGVKNGGM